MNRFILRFFSRKEIPKKNFFFFNIHLFERKNYERLKIENEKNVSDDGFCRHLTCSTGRFTYLSTCLPTYLRRSLRACLRREKKDTDGGVESLTPSPWKASLASALIASSLNRGGSPDKTAVVDVRERPSSPDDRSTVHTRERFYQNV